jgi:hypothetical protein
MIRRTSALLVTFALALGACSSEEPIATTTAPTTSTTTTSTLPTTTTTIAPVSVEGAPPALALLVNDFYTFAAGGSTTAPKAPDSVIAGIDPGDFEAPRDGEASVATFAEQQVAVVMMGADTFLAVEDGDGWRITGGEWPSLDVGRWGRLVADDIFAAALGDLLTDEDAREAAASAGVVRAAERTWAVVAEEHRAVYRSVARG